MFLKGSPFIDYHIHFFINGRALKVQEFEAIAKRYLQAGVSTVYDMGHRSAIGLRFKRFNTTALKIKTAGYALYKRGFYGSFLGVALQDKEDIKKHIDFLYSAGADFIKVIYSGIVDFREKPYITDGGFTKEQLKMICEQAQKKGLKVVCHVNGDAAIAEAVEAGVSSIEHGFFMSNDTVWMLKEYNVYWTPTVFALKTYAETLPEYARVEMEKVVDRHLETLNYAASVGVPLRVGSDSGSKGVIHADAFWQEIRLFRKAGLSVNQIVSAACTDPQDAVEKDWLLKMLYRQQEQ